jgi:hypothetical protein
MAVVGAGTARSHAEVLLCERTHLPALHATRQPGADPKDPPMKLRTRLTAAVCTALLIAAPAMAETDEAFEPDLTPHQEWFSCDGGEYQEWTANALLDGMYPTWKPVEPTASVADGEGCANASPNAVRGVRPQTPFDANFVGTFRGNLDEITVSMHNIYVGTARAGGDITLRMRMTVNGQSLFGTESVTNAAGDEFQEPAVREIVVTPQPTGATGAAELLEFTVTDIGLLSEDYSTRRNRIEIVFETANTNSTRQNLWVWGNTEAPSSITFNPEEHAAVTTSAGEEDW